MELTRRFIIQDRESCKFLHSVGGEICFTPWIREAAHFYEEEAALETALINCGDGFAIFQFWILERH